MTVCSVILKKVIKLKQITLDINKQKVAQKFLKTKFKCKLTST